MINYLITESQVISLLLKNYTSILIETKKNPQEKLWNVFKLGTSEDVNGYSITSSNYPDNVIGPIISAVKNKWKNQGDLYASDSPDGYMYQYILRKIVDTVKTNPEVLRSKTIFSRAIREYFPVIEKLNIEPLNKTEAEELKRKMYKNDRDSFKHKGAAILGMGGGSGGKTLPPELKGKKPLGNTKDVLRELYGYDEIYYSGRNWVFTDYAYNEMMNSDLPSSIKSQIKDVYNDPKSVDISNSKRRLIHNNPVLINMFNNWQRIFDNEVFPEDDE